MAQLRVNEYPFIDRLYRWYGSNRLTEVGLSCKALQHML